MTKEIEMETKENMIKWVREYRNALPESKSLHDTIHIQVTYWMEDVLTIMYHDEKYSIENLYGTDIFNAALTLKVYKILRDLHITFEDWKFDITNRAIEDVSTFIFNEFIKFEEI